LYAEIKIALLAWYLQIFVK